MRHFVVACVLFMFFFFKQKTAYEMRISDWSSDVCSSDLIVQQGRESIRSQADPTICRQVLGRSNLKADVSRNHHATRNDSNCFAALYRRGYTFGICTVFQWFRRGIVRRHSEADFRFNEAWRSRPGGFGAPQRRSEERRVGKGGVSR